MENSEEFIDYLIMIGRLDEAAIKLAEIVNKVLYMYMHTCLLSSLLLPLSLNLICSIIH